MECVIEGVREVRTCQTERGQARRQDKTAENNCLQQHGKCVGFADRYSSLVELTCKQITHRLVFLSNWKGGKILAADMTRYEEIFAAVGAVKGMRLRGRSNEWLATA